MHFGNAMQSESNKHEPWGKHDIDEDTASLYAPCWLGQHLLGALFALMFGFVGSLAGEFCRIGGQIFGASMGVAAIISSALESSAGTNAALLGRLLCATLTGATAGAAACLLLPPGPIMPIVHAATIAGGATAGYNVLVMFSPSALQPGARNTTDCCEA